MRPTAIRRAVEAAIDNKQPTMVWGPPGSGKSSVIRQISQARKVTLIDQRLSQMDPVDLRGIPTEKHDMTHWLTPEFLPNEKRDGEEGILFLDEINSAAQSTMAAGYQLILDRRLGNYVLPDGWAIVAAGNNENDRAIVNKMSTALRNRFMHLDFEVHADDWRAWALQSGIREEVLGFIGFRTPLLDEFGSDAAKSAKAFATPRSWEFVSRMMPQKTSSHDEEFGIYKGIVGDGPASEFLGYLKYHRNLPNMDALLLNPGKAPVPEEPATLYAVATALAARATPENFPAVVTYLKRIGPEFQVLCAKDAVIRDAEIAETKAFNVWSTSHGNLMV